MNKDNQISNQDFVGDFKKIKIIHPKMKRLMISLKTLIEQPFGNEIVLVLGPSGVGKSTLIHELKKEIIKESLAELEKDKSILPLVVVELVSPDNGLFNWKDFYIRTLQAMEEPLINKKILYGNNNEFVKRSGIDNHNPRTAPELRRSVENALYYRKPKVFIIDEAQHFTKMTSGRRYSDQLDSLKSLSNLTKTPQILVGTYDLKEFVNLNGQLARRTTDIQFPRYDLSVDEDFKNYIGIIQGLLERIPIQVSTEIIQNYEYIYERTLGCVGILKDWLTRSLKICLEQNDDILKLWHLEHTALSINKISKLLDEILLGESLFIEKVETITAVRSKLGLTIPNNHEEQIKVKRDVGKRKPKRDKVGLDID